jgi:hypothetical protein
MKEIINNLPSLTALLTSITDIVLKLSAKKAVPAKQKEINDITELYIKAQSQALELQQAAIDKDKKIMELENKLIDKRNLKYEKYAYFEYDGDKQIDGPFCQNCYETKGLKIHLIETIKKGKHVCKSCKEIYIDSACFKSSTTRKSGPSINAWYKNQGIQL